MYSWYKRLNVLDYNHGWIDITEVLIHPNYSALYQQNPGAKELEPMYNVALLKLKDSIGQHEFFGNPHSDIIRPICLPESGFVDSMVGQSAYTSRFLEKQLSTIINSWECANHFSQLKWYSVFVYLLLDPIVLYSETNK